MPTSADRARAYDADGLAQLADETGDYRLRRASEALDQCAEESTRTRLPRKGLRDDGSDRRTQ